MSSQRQYFPMVDAVKAIAAQLIVLHHLAWFGPMSDVVAAWSPFAAGWQSWLAEYGRYAVAAFLATAGFLAGQALGPQGLPPGRTPLCLILQRYVRLVGPFAAALGLAIASAALARTWMTHDSIGSLPTVKQLLAHLLLLQDLLDYEALSAGAWYVAIDFQLYALLVVLVWLAGQIRHRLPSADFFGLLVVTTVALASLFHFNRDAQWDATALYFFGSYAVGVGCAWASRTRLIYPALLFVALLGGMALVVDFRPRLAVALATALALGVGQLLWRAEGQRILAVLSQHSYALFLVHFPVCLLVNAALVRFDPDDGPAHVLGLLLAWTLSNLASIYFHRYLEKPLARVWPLKPACHVAR